MVRKQLLAAILLMALCMMLAFRPVLASVGLVYFKAEPHSANTIMLTWETATESGTTGFRVYRSDNPAPADWGAEITFKLAAGNAVSGSSYSHEDTVVPGVMYYYLLREVTSGGVTDLLPTASARISVTPTATASRIPSATWTSPAPSGGANALPTATTPPPTATRQFTNTPAISPLGTPTFQAATPVPLRTTTPTSLPPASVASPTGLVAAVTIPPTLTQAAGQPATLAPVQASPTVDVTSTVVGPAETATPRPTKDVTPIIFAAETTPGSGSPTPTNTEQVAGQEGRSGSLALMIGGSALGLAGLATAGFLFFRSRKS